MGNDLEPTCEFGRDAYEAFGGLPWDVNYTPPRTQVATLRCPSDPAMSVGVARFNYAFNYGDASYFITHGVIGWNGDEAVKRGMWDWRRALKLNSCLDGPVTPSPWVKSGLTMEIER